MHHIRTGRNQFFKVSFKYMASKRKRHLELVQKIKYHDHLYYMDSKPEITDYEYDMLFSELKKIELENPDLISPDSPTQRVSDAPAEGFKKAPHSIPMLSLQNTYNTEEILDFDKRTKKSLAIDEGENIEYFCEPKFDGLAIELIYQKGVLTSAITRGDGKVGEDVLSNVRTIRSIPMILKGKTVPDLLEVRGEIVILKKDFKKLNKQQEENGLPALGMPPQDPLDSLTQRLPPQDH